MARVGQRARRSRAQPARHHQVQKAKLHIRPQPVHRQALHQAGREAVLHIDQQPPARVDHQKIHQILALRCQQPGPKRCVGGKRRDVIGHQPVEKAARIIASDAENGTIIEQRGRGSVSHAAKVGRLA